MDVYLSVFSIFQEGQVGLPGDGTAARMFNCLCKSKLPNFGFKLTVGEHFV